MFDTHSKVEINQDHSTITIMNQEETMIQSLALGNFKFTREDKTIYLSKEGEQTLLGVYQSQKAAIRVCMEIMKYLSKPRTNEMLTLKFPPINAVPGNGEGFVWIFGL